MPAVVVTWLHSAHMCAHCSWPTPCPTPTSGRQHHKTHAQHRYSTHSTPWQWRVQHAFAAGVYVRSRRISAAHHPKHTRTHTPGKSSRIGAHSTALLGYLGLAHSLPPDTASHTSTSVSAAINMLNTNSSKHAAAFGSVKYTSLPPGNAQAEGQGTHTQKRMNRAAASLVSAE